MRSCITFAAILLFSNVANVHGEGKQSQVDLLQRQIDSLQKQLSKLDPARSEELPTAERRLLQARLRARLSEKDVALRRREKQRDRTTYSGGSAADATELINLIQTTVAPDTWEINGGRGSIYYFPNR